jgi:L-serine dehydratase
LLGKIITEGRLPGGLNIKRRSCFISRSTKPTDKANMNDWLCACLMAVNEENAAGHMVVTAPTSAAGVTSGRLLFS